MLKFLLTFFVLTFYRSAFVQVPSTSDFFPIIDATNEKLVQKVRITTKDSVEFCQFVYQIIKENNKSYLVTDSYDNKANLTVSLKEKMTKRGLKYFFGEIYFYDLQDNFFDKYRVKALKKVTFPFKPISKMKNWKVNWKASYDRKVVVHSKIEYLGTEIIQYNGQATEVIYIKRTAKKIYKRRYKKEIEAYEITMTFAKNLGLIQYSQKGKDAYEAVIISNEIK